MISRVISMGIWSVITVGLTSALIMRIRRLERELKQARAIADQARSMLNKCYHGVSVLDPCRACRAEFKQYEGDDWSGM